MRRLRENCGSSTLGSFVWLQKPGSTLIRSPLPPRSSFLTSLMPRSTPCASRQATVQSTRHLVLHQQPSINSTCALLMTFGRSSTHPSRKRLNLTHCKLMRRSSSWPNCCRTSLIRVTSPFSKASFHSHRGTPSWVRDAAHTASLDYGCRNCL